MDRYILEKDEDWRGMVSAIPFIQFDDGWQIQVIPPFGGAMARFRVLCNGKTVSVYLDCHERLGIYGEPYWEVYPYQGDVGRCAMADTAQLLTMIRHSITHDGE